MSENEDKILLSPGDIQLLCDVIYNPPPLTFSLKKAIAKYEDLVRRGLLTSE